MNKKELNLSTEEVLNNLSNLNLKEKRELFELLKKKKEVERMQKLQQFKANPGAQEAFFKSTAYGRVIMGGNRLGKSTISVVDGLMLASGTHPHRYIPVPNKGRIVVAGATQIFNTIVPKLEEWSPPGLIIDIKKDGGHFPAKIILNNGSNIELMTHDQEPKKFESADLDWIMFDEPPPRDIFIACTRGLIDRSGCWAAAMTPIGEPWIYNELYLPWNRGERTDIEIYEGDSYENIAIPKEEIDRYKLGLRGDEILTRIQGKFQHLSGVIFKEFNRKIHVIEPFKWEDPVICAIDPHPRKPHHVLFVGIKNEEFYILEEAKIEGSLKELGFWLKNKEQDYNIVKTIIDSLAVTQDLESRRSGIDVLYACGVKGLKIATKVEKSIQLGIDRIKGLLRVNTTQLGERPSLFFFNSCPNIISDIENWVWDEFRNSDKTGVKERPKEEHKDFIDCLRYAIAISPKNGRHIIKPVEIGNLIDNPDPYGVTNNEQILFPDISREERRRDRFSITGSIYSYKRRRH